ncbi:hypothetical protein HDU96_003760 [Phlyctochytrium bullatum]|nr:hypothetical protein HDU96_003760 [Phlyctochytrium bullatum]
MSLLFKPLVQRRLASLRFSSNATFVPVGGLPTVEETRKSLPPAVSAILADYPSLVTLGVQWGEQDAYGHLNNVHYMRYFESGRIAYFDQVIGQHLSKVDYDNFIKAKTVGPILKSASIKYVAPVEYPDTLTIGVTVKKESIGADRFVQSFKAVSHKLGRVVAEGEAVVVTYDYQAKTKANIPETIRKLM